MKLFASFSEAIREGAKIRPQAFGFWCDGAGNSCAIGAALEAILERPPSSSRDHRDRSPEYVALVKTYKPELDRDVLMPCGCSVLTDGPEEFGGERPEIQGEFQRIDRIIVHLNNAHRWTREAIANWLETEEAKLGYVTLTESAEVFASEKRAVV